MADLGIALVGAALVFVAALVARRERRLFAERDDFPAKILEYTRARYRRRLIGCAIVVMLGAIFGAFPFVPVAPRVVELYWMSVAAFVIALVVLAVLDLRETHRQLSQKMSGDALKDFMRESNPSTSDHERRVR